MSAIAATLALRERIGDNTLDRIFEAWPLMSEDESRKSPLSAAERAALERLLEAARSGDAGAQETFYGMYKSRVFGLAFRHTGDPVAAEDLLQDIFIKVFTHLGDVRDVETMPAWIYRIALNTCFSYLRGRQLRSRIMVPLSAIEGRPEEAARDTRAEGLGRPIEESLRELPPGLRSVFVLHDIEGFKHEEIGRILGCTVGTSKSQLFKARIRIREILRKKGLL